MKNLGFALSIYMTLALAAQAQDPINPNYIVYPEPTLIQRDLGDLERVYRRNYQKFIAYTAPNGREILLVATDEVSDEQLLRAYNILDFYLTNVPGSEYGADKSAVANAMADNEAVLNLPGGSDGNATVWSWAIRGQPLYALEFPIEGSAPYINNDYGQRDAGFEEIFHMVHDTGIGTKFTDGVLKSTYQADIAAATVSAQADGRWASGDEEKEWIAELAAEGSLEQEYIASVIDSYYGYWGAFSERPGGMWGIYVAKTRDEVRRLDPKGYALMEQFLSPTLTYMARIDPGFDGTFELQFDPDQPYTHKSQYLVNARLLGGLPSGLAGNDHDNVLIGNAGDNRIDGRDGEDVVQYSHSSKDVSVSRDGASVLVSGPGIGTDRLTNIETLRFTDRDVTTSSI